MSQFGLEDHPQRYALANELHARPFPELTAPCRAVFLAIAPVENAASRPRDADVAHLLELLDRFGAPHPAPEANHHFATLGRVTMKWERHTEFVTYTIFAEGVADRPFSGSVFETFPRDWLARAPGRIVTSILIRVESLGSDAEIDAALDGRVRDWFVPESLAMARVAEGEAAVAGDFRIDPAGHVRFAVLARSDISPRRLGRLVQRLIEIETYKSMAMLTFPVARQVGGRVAALDRRLLALVQSLADRREGTNGTETLGLLLGMSSEIEAISSSSSFRFGAAEAYEAIVNQRVEVLREQRIRGRQTFAEFMARRFDPAMRTCRSTKQRMDEFTQRAARAANLLRTQVEVAMQAQNRSLLESMDRRADLQLRLQQTVEGLSVVAISYYAVSLASYALAPLATWLALPKDYLVAASVLPIFLAVWLMVRRIRNRIAPH